MKNEVNDILSWLFYLDVFSLASDKKDSFLDRLRGRRVLFGEVLQNPCLVWHILYAGLGFALDQIDGGAPFPNGKLEVLFRDSHHPVLGRVGNISWLHLVSLQNNVKMSVDIVERQTND